MAREVHVDRDMHGKRGTRDVDRAIAELARAPARPRFAGAAAPACGQLRRNRPPGTGRPASRRSPRGVLGWLPARHSGGSLDRRGAGRRRSGRAQPLLGRRSLAASHWRRPDCGRHRGANAPPAPGHPLPPRVPPVRRADHVQWNPRDLRRSHDLRPRGGREAAPARTSDERGGRPATLGAALSGRPASPLSGPSGQPRGPPGTRGTGAPDRASPAASSRRRSSSSWTSAASLAPS